MTILRLVVPCAILVLCCAAAPVSSLLLRELSQSESLVSACLHCPIHGPPPGHTRLLPSRQTNCNNMVGSRETWDPCSRYNVLVSKSFWLFLVQELFLSKHSAELDGGKQPFFIAWEEKQFSCPLSLLCCGSFYLCHLGRNRSNNALLSLPFLLYTRVQAVIPSQFLVLIQKTAISCQTRWLAPSEWMLLLVLAWP